MRRRIRQGGVKAEVRRAMIATAARASRSTIDVPSLWATAKTSCQVDWEHKSMMDVCVWRTTATSSTCFEYQPARSDGTKMSKSEGRALHAAPNPVCDASEAKIKSSGAFRRSTRRRGAMFASNANSRIRTSDILRFSQIYSGVARGSTKV